MPSIKLTALLAGLAVTVAAVHLCGSQAKQKTSVAFAIDVLLAEVPVLVFDAKGSLTLGLQKSDFHLTEDGIEQRLLFCERERQPVSFVILDDLSQSMTNRIEFIRDATASILDPITPAEDNHDEYSLFGIDDRVTRLIPFTSNTREIESLLPSLITPTNGATALLDGIYAGVGALSDRAKNKRRAVIIISDGGDNHSRHGLRETRRFLQEAGVPVFAVMAGKQLEHSLPPANLKINKFPISIAAPAADIIGPAEREGPRNLKTLTEVTGGGVFTASNSESLSRIVRTISLAVRYQYLLGYEPQPTEAKKTKDNWHSIRIELTPRNRFLKYNLYYKQGYYRN